MVKLKELMVAAAVVLFLFAALTVPSRYAQADPGGGSATATCPGDSQCNNNCVRLPSGNCMSSTTCRNAPGCTPCQCLTAAKVCACA